MRRRDTWITFSAIALLLVSAASSAAQQQTPEERMIAAVKACDLTTVKALSSQRPDLLLIRGKDDYGAGDRPLLHLAAVCKDIDLARFLIDQKVDINGSMDGWTALHTAATRNNLPLVNLLIANHANVNAKDNSGYTPIFFGSAEIAKVLLDNGADPSITDVEGRTILHYKPEKALIETIAAHAPGFNFSARDRGGRTPLHIAIKGAVAFCTSRKNPSSMFSTAGLEDVQALVAAGADVNARDQSGLTPLMEGSNYEELVTLLLSKGADINAVDAYHRTVLHQIVQPPFPEPKPLRPNPHLLFPPPCGLDLDPVKKLEFFLAHGVDPNRKGYDDLSAFAMLAGARDRVGMLKALNLLVAYHANLDLRDKDGNSLAQIAVAADNLEMVEFLDSHHANLKITDKDGNSLLHTAAARNNFELVDFFLRRGLNPNLPNAIEERPLHKTSDTKVARLLLQYKANFYALTTNHLTPLSYAVSTGPLDLVQLLLSFRSSPLSKDIFDWSVMHRAAGKGNVEIMEALVKAGAAIDRRDPDYRTPLYDAIAWATPSIDAVKFLVAHGADLNARDRSNRTPLHEALMNTPSEAKLAAARFLLANGANPSLRDNRDKTPLDRLREQRDYYVVHGGGYANEDPRKSFDGLIAILEPITVTVPERKIFGELTLDGKRVNGTIVISDAAEPHSRLAWIDIKNDGRFELRLREGQGIRIFAYFDGEKEGKKVRFLVPTEWYSKTFTVNGDLGPISVPLSRFFERSRD